MNQRAQSDLLRKVRRLHRWRYPLVALVGLNGFMLITAQGVPGRQREVVEKTTEKKTSSADAATDRRGTDVRPPQLDVVAVASAPPSSSATAHPSETDRPATSQGTSTVDRPTNDVSPTVDVSSKLAAAPVPDTRELSPARQARLSRWYAGFASSAQRVAGALSAAPHRDPFAPTAADRRSTVGSASATANAERRAKTASTPVDSPRSPSPAPSTPPSDRGITASGVRLSNPVENQVEVRFLAGGKQINLPAGARIELPAEAPIEVVFDRGGDFGSWKGRLAPGRTYRFHVDNQGWRLDPDKS